MYFANLFIQYRGLLPYINLTKVNYINLPLILPFMQLISDLHIHSKHSRACSKDLDIKNLEKYARIKGVNLLGTGDFTHPEWIKELKKELKEDGSGVLKTQSGFPFILQTELSLIYSQDGKGRRVHNVVLAPNFEVVDQITDELKKRGRIDYDGRPIFKLSCIEFTEMLMNISKDIEVIPAHIWTPWFSLFGSNSGFDSIKQAFGDQLKHIHALETGLSSDPAMNWRLSQLDDFSLVSFSDLHSYWPWRIGREATVFDLKELTYKNLIHALRNKGVKETIEVDPAYGKYHFDGHRNCNVSLSPKESMKLNKICPVCGKPLTIGVDYRVEELADRELGFKPKDAAGFRTLIPLAEILSKLYKKGIATKTITQKYYELVTKERSEMDILLNLSEEKLKKLADEKVVDVILKNREGKIKVIPGYDGVYGVPVFDEKDIPKEKEIKVKKKQKGLTDFM